MTFSIQIHEIERGEFPKGLTDKSGSGLKYVVSKFVFFNERIVNETAKLIPNLVNRERIQYITMHALSRLLDLKPLMKSMLTE